MELTKPEITKVFAMYLHSKIILDNGDEVTLNVYNLNYYRDFLDSCKLILTPLSEISDEHAIEVAKCFYPLSFKGNCNTGWIVQRDKIYPNEILNINHKCNAFSFNVDLVDGNVTLYRDGEYDPGGSNVAAVDKIREFWYMLPYKGVDLFKAGIAIPKH